MRSPLTLTELRESLTPEQAGELQKVSPETIRRRCRSGQYTKFANVGTENRPQWRVHPSELVGPVPEPADAAA